MVKVRAYRGYVCNQALQNKLPSPPYDVLNSEEAKIMAEGNQYSFLHVNKPEIDLPPQTDLYSDIVYETGKKNLQEFIKNGYLHRDPSNVIYIYSQQFTAPENLVSAPQYGLMLEASIQDYEDNKIKKHELTRKDKEADRTKLTHVQNANVGPVFLTYNEVPAINDLVDKVVKGYPAFLDYMTEENNVKVRHMVWKCPGDVSQQLEKLFASDVKEMYIADGHHRSASAYNVGAERRKLMKEAGKEITGEEEFNYYMALVYPKNQLKILDYNRVMKDLNGNTKEQIFEKLKAIMEVQEIGKEQYKPQKKGEIGFLMDGIWYKLTIKPEFRKPGHPVDNLDVEILYKNILLPVFDIQDIRTSKRIDFVGGIRGLGELEKRCQADCKCAFAMYPVQIEEVMDVADKQQIMPPKSTWFEPKPSSGAIVRCMDYTLEDYMNLQKK